MRRLTKERVTFMQDNLARKLPQTAPKTQRRAVRKPAAKQKFRWKLAIMSVVYFALIMLVMSRYATINELEREISVAKSEFEQLQSENISKKVDIQQSINIDEIEKTATEKLGMVKPGQNQIVNIQVVMEDKGDILQNQEQTGIFAMVSRSFGKIISYLH